MRIVDFLTIVFGASLTTLYVNSKPVYAYSTILLTDDIIRVKKRNDDTAIGYLEQCGPVTFPMAQRGVVNVLAFLDSSWPYSHRQAIMLKMLNDRLRRSGLPDALFFVVNVDPSFLHSAENPEDDIEKEAWLGVSPDEIDHFSDIERTTDSLKLSMSPGIQLIQDNKDLGIWKELRGSRDQVLVIDRCGKLTYQVIVPWSILHFPYVKAAILSTYKDEPCGPCNIINNATEASYREKNERTSLDFNTESSSTKDYYFQSDREDRNISNIPVKTESNIRTDDSVRTVDDEPKNFVSSTSEYENSNRNINEKTSIASFPEFDSVNESTTASNLITTRDNIAAVFESDNFDDVTTSLPTDITSTVNNDPRQAEHPISPNFVTLDVANSTDSVISGVTEEITKSETTTANQLEEKKRISTIEQNSHRAEKNNDHSTDIYDVTDSVTTSATTRIPEDNFTSYADEILSITEPSTTLEDNTKAKEDDSTLSATSFDTLKSIVGVKTDENFDSSTLRNLRIRDESKMNEDIQVPQENSKDSEVIERVEVPFELPIRIIMHAPHFHADGDSTRMHEYLILKTGNTEHHSHLASHDATRLYSGLQDFHEKVDDTPNEDIEAKEWSMTNVIYNKNESPGLYGEVADFWRGTGSQETYDDAEDTERPEEEQIAEETGTVVWNTPSKTNNEKTPESDNIVTATSFLPADDPVTALETTETLQADVAPGIATDEYPMNIEEFNAEEEETRNKLIAHYSKLLPWIYYVLDK